MPGGKGSGDKPHRRSGGGGRGKTDDRETTISKNLSYVLRHGAKSMGIAMDEKGFVNVADLLSHNRFRSIKATFPEIQSVVSSNAKQRFELVPISVPASDRNPSNSDSLDPSTQDEDASPIPATSARPPNPNNPGNYLIRATQGHSIKGLETDSLLTPILPSDKNFPAEVVHGTYPSSWKLILESGGLKPMGRTHIHFATGLPGGGLKPASGTVAAVVVAEKDSETKTEDDVGVRATPDAAPVISGMRASASLLIWIDVRRSIEKGSVKWWRSKNGVVLTEGIVGDIDGVSQKEGLLPLDYVSRVVERRTGNVIWKSDWWDDGAGSGNA